MNKKKIYGSAIAFLLLLFAACSMISPDPDRMSGHDGKATVHVRIGGTDTQGRTVSPTVGSSDVTAWELRGEKQGKDMETLARFSEAGGTTVVLDSGIWNFTLLGYKDNAVILTGSLTGQTISPDTPNTLTFTVAPVSEEGYGTVNLVVELPLGSGITRAQVLKDGTALSSYVYPTGYNTIVVTGTYPAGVSRFSIRLYNDNADLYGVISEAVYVWANLVSAKTYTLTLEDLSRTYLITYHLWEGQTDTGDYRQTDAAFTFDPPTAAPPGYTFGGWYDNARFEGDPVMGIPAGSTGDKNFYAYWEPVLPHTVTFNANGGSPGTQTRIVNHGDSLSSGISNIEYDSVSGSATWTLLADGRRQSPRIGDGRGTKARIRFTTYAVNASVTIQLDVSSESGYDYAFISTLDNANAAYNSGSYPGSVISGTQSKSVTIPVPTAGSHFIDIGYQKDGSQNGGSDCAWFKVTGSNLGDSPMPSEPTKSLHSFDGWYTLPNGGGEQFTAETLVTGDITVYANWLSSISNIEYDSVSGSAAWTLLADGRRQSPAISDNGLTKARIRFTTYAVNASVTIQLDVSSESGYDYAFISTLDNANATSDGGYYTDSKISGTQSKSVTIPVPTAGDHFIDIGYQKDGSQNGGSDCAWFFTGTITYSSVSGGAWTLLDDGRRKSPATSHGSVTKARISFATDADNASITIQLDVSSESGYDYAFISMLDNADATYQSGFYTGSLISGTQSKSVTIPVPTAGDHFIDIGYRKDGEVSSGSDCAWFKVIALRD